MNKILPILVIGIFVLSGSVVVALNVEIENNFKTINFEDQVSGSQDYSHTVFVEVASAHFCGHCHNWNANIYNTYDSDQYDFEYVEMIVYWNNWNDILNFDAWDWKNLYGITGYPTSILDGDYRRIGGNDPGQLPSTLNACGNRAVADIDANMIVTWLGDATIKIDIEIDNNEVIQYNGFMRVPITEITSRYTTSGGARFHSGFLDYAFTMNTAISIPAGGTYTNSVTWDGNEHHDNDGNYFGDIEPDNIKVILAVFNNNNDYVDETVAAVIKVNQPPEKPTITGELTGKIGTEYEYTFVSTDPEGDNITYCIDWGDNTSEFCIGPYPSDEEASAKHIWSEEGTYIIKAKAKDIYGAESDWAKLEVSMPKTHIHNTIIELLLKMLERFPFFEKN
jgi:hypothetical protein